MEPADARKVALGRKLFHDPRLSKDGKISCATCHPLDHGGTDGQQHSRGSGGRAAQLNTPTVFNARYSFHFNWSGNYDTLEAELDAPVQGPMDRQWPELVQWLRDEPRYASQFAAVYPDAVTEANLRNALAEFERTLITPNCRFDKWLRGDNFALTDMEQQGYALFKSHGCSTCHQGINAGGNMYQRLGVMEDYFAARGQVVKADLGRYNATADPDDRHVFRVPSLRNVAVTAPYFHDGSAATLRDAVGVMARFQLGQTLDETTTMKIIAFLNTLTGEYPGPPQ